MKLFIVRHGYTDALEQGIVQGHRFGQLNERGKEQARRVGLRLRDVRIDRLFMSDLDRVVETAQEILKYHPDVEIVQDERLRERGSGMLEGKPTEEWMAAYHASGMEFHHFRPEQGESLLDLFQRTARWLVDFRTTPQPEHIVVVSHGGTIRSLLTLLFHGETYENHPEYRHHNTGVTVVEISGSGDVTLKSLNDISHLEGMSEIESPNE